MPYYLNTGLSYHLQCEPGRPIGQGFGPGISGRLTAISNEIPVCGHTSPLAWTIPPLAVWLRPSKDGRGTTSLPEFSKVDRSPGRPGDFQGNFSGMPHHFGSDVNDLSSQGGGIGADLYHRGAHILFERLVDKEGNEHCIVEGGILGKPLEGELFGAEVFEGPVDQFITAAPM